MSYLVWYFMIFYLLNVSCLSWHSNAKKAIFQVVLDDHILVKRDVNSSSDIEVTTEPTKLTTDQLTNTPTTSQLQMTSTENTTPEYSSIPPTEEATIQSEAKIPPTEEATVQSPEQTTSYSNVMTETDSHIYYKSRIISDNAGLYWNKLQGHTRHELSNDKHMWLKFIKLSFKFPFYGHPVDHLAITTQGFLYMNSFTHPRLDYTFTNYLAPLMANFDTIGNYSDILHKDDGNSFVVEWRTVELNDQVENGNYTFQTTLFKNGTIIFSYKMVPETNISGLQWPVKVGISDAFFYDYNTIFGILRTVYKYHSVSFNITKLKDNLVIILDPLPTCNLATTCDECTTLNISFSCGWCHAISRCSDGLDRHRQDWHDSNCASKAVTSQDVCSSTENGKPTTRKPGSPEHVFTSDDTQSATKDESKEREGANETVMIVVPMVVAVALIIVVIVVVYCYARTHPNTKSGQWLIEHRPSKLKEKFSNVSFSKDPETGDTVRIDSACEARVDTSTA